MRVAALYDIHGNLPALEAVLEEVAAAGVDRIVIGGDVAWGAFPKETVARLMELGDDTIFIQGNADREVAAGLEEPESDVTGWSARQLTGEQREFLTSFEPTVVVDVEGLGPTLFCHGSPKSDEDIITALTPEDVVADLLGDIDAQIVVGGHTHVQIERSIGETRFVNAGSVGMPAEGRPGAYWALLGPDVSLRRTEYDFHRAAERIREGGMPEAAEFAKEVLSPYSRDEAIQHFEGLAGR